jgi:Ca2+-binding RTX toxin-like protein
LPVFEQHFRAVQAGLPEKPMFPDSVEIYGAFDMRLFFAPASTAIATISGDAAEARVTLQNGTVLVYAGTDLMFSDGVPTGGIVTAVSVLDTAGAPLALLTLTQNPWNFADITTAIPFQSYLANPQGVLDALDPAQGASASNIFGGNQGDFLVSTGGADTLRGVDGDDFFGIAGPFFQAGGQPAGLVIYGGAGFDTLQIASSSQEVDTTLDLREVTLQSIERLFLLGGAVHISADQLGTNRLARNAEIFFQPGTQLVIDQIAGRTLDVSQFTAPSNTLGPGGFSIRLIGTEVADRQIGNALFNDVLEGNAGDDRLSGLGGFDTLFGGIGDDTLFGGDGGPEFENGADELYGGDGDDRIIGGIGDAFLVGGAGNDRIIAGTGRSVVLGDEGDDWLTAGTSPGGFGGFGGDSFLFGGTGNDTLSSGTGGGSFSGDEGDDTYIIRDDLVFLFEATGGGNDVIRTYVSLDLSGGENPENDAGEFETIGIVGQTGLSIIGTVTDNRIVGNIGADTLSGGDGADRLEGGRGADVLSGGTGADTLIGGADADRFVFATGFGADLVTDFKVDIDVIDLTGLEGITSFVDLIADFIRQDGRNVVIDAGAGDVLTLSNVRLATLDAADFLFG